MKIEELQQLIESKEVTTDHFNVFLETLPGSSDERRAHHTRPKRHHERNKNPVTDASTVSREGDTAPDTGRRRRAIRNQGDKNKQKRNRQKSQKDAVEQFESNSFSEALEFINAHHTLPIAECVNDLNRVSDKERLNKLVTRLMGTTNHNINRDWLYNVHWNLTDTLNESIVDKIAGSVAAGIVSLGTIFPALADVDVSQVSTDQLKQLIERQASGMTHEELMEKLRPVKEFGSEVGHISTKPPRKRPGAFKRLRSRFRRGR